MENTKSETERKETVEPISNLLVKSEYEFAKPYQTFITNVMPILAKFMAIKDAVSLLDNLYKNNVGPYRPVSSTGNLIIGKRKSDPDGSFFCYELSFRDPKVRIAEWRDRILVYTVKCDDTKFGEKLSHDLLEKIRVRRDSTTKDGKQEVEWFVMKGLTWDNVKSIVDNVCALVKAIKEHRMITRLNINAASIEQLMTLYQIGINRATNIYNYRKRHGAFKDMNDLYQVDGIGTGIVTCIKEFIYFGVSGEYDAEYTVVCTKSSRVPKNKTRIVNINTAPVRELMGLPGVGTVLANRIIACRPYSKISDIKSVRMIGDGRFADIKDLITV
jgi:competence ComEA-like helix-hairpin-helix protein